MYIITFLVYLVFRSFVHFKEVELYIFQAVSLIIILIKGQYMRFIYDVKSVVFPKMPVENFLIVFLILYSLLEILSISYTIKKNKAGN